MDSMSDMERRCLDKALAVPLAHNGENDFWSYTAGIVRAVLAEAGVAELVEALRRAHLAVCFNTCERPGKTDAEHSDVCKRTTAAIAKIRANQ